MKDVNFVYEHPFGTILGRVGEVGVQELELPASKTPVGALARKLDSPPVEALKQLLRKALDRYFAGEKEGFYEIPLDLSGATPFRREVWETARRVEYGEASSYGGLALLMGRGVGTSRAIGQALGANPIPIIVPCHRFLSGDGTIGGFSCGLHWKRELLALEGITYVERGGRTASLFEG